MSWWNPIRYKANDNTNASTDAQLERRRNNPRRYPRVYLFSDEPSQQSLAGASLWGAEAKLESGLTARIYDLSHSGVALLREDTQALEGLTPDSKISFEISFSELGDFKMQGRIARVSERVVAIDFEATNAEARMALIRFLEAKTIGLSLRRVDPKFFNSLSDGFTDWFQGPNETNVFLRFDDNVLRAAQVTIGNDVLEWRSLEDGRSEYHSVRIQDDIEVDKPQAAIDDRALVKRVIEMLAQMRDEKSSIDPLIRVLLDIAP